MEFKDVTEFQEALKRAMELCMHAGISLEQNFKRIYKSTCHGIVSGLKLSGLAYRLVCVNGKTSNPSVVRLQIELILKNIK